MKELYIINPENVSEDEADAYPIREASRAVVIDDEGRIALLHVSNKKYYKLPGGGVDTGENRIEALHRECLEEIGCDIEVLHEIGTIVEYRKIFNLKQISHCYLAKVKGAKGAPALEKGEIEDGFKEVWLSYDDALQSLYDSDATDMEGSAYIVPRDIFFLKAAKQKLPNQGR